MVVRFAPLVAMGRLLMMELDAAVGPLAAAVDLAPTRCVPGAQRSPSQGRAFPGCPTP